MNSPLHFLRYEHLTLKQGAMPIDLSALTRKANRPLFTATNDDFSAQYSVYFSF
ncbi:hypothetical protein ANAPH2_00764 [Anaplasma phagocytophilum]|nr:hypothetical protein ANAPH2_00764 [Anaplasma phagocytophilum]